MIDQAKKQFIDKNESGYKEIFKQSLQSLAQEDHELSLGLIEQIACVGTIDPSMICTVKQCATSISSPPPVEYRKPNKHDIDRKNLIKQYLKYLLTMNGYKTKKRHGQEFTNTKF